MKMPASNIQHPDDQIEKSYFDLDQVVCGIDEVGRGAWAGPLVLACVVPGTGTIDGVRDSKKISPKKREKLNSEIFSWAKAIGIGEVTNSEIDDLGLGCAITLGANRAFENALKQCDQIDCALLDGHYDFLKRKDTETRTIVKGDNISHAIAAASIVAKVYRDDLMSRQDLQDEFPSFKFASNKGYPAPVHRQALVDHGPTRLHRVSWSIFGDTLQKYEQKELI